MVQTKISTLKNAKVVKAFHYYLLTVGGLVVGALVGDSVGGSVGALVGGSVGGSVGALVGYNERRT